MSITAEVTDKDLQHLLKIFKEKSFVAGACEEGSTEHLITKKCEVLYKQDYTLFVLDNRNGSLCPGYPSQIVFPDCELPYTSTAMADSFLDEYNSLPNSSIITNNLNQNSASTSSSKSSANVAFESNQNKEQPPQQQQNSNLQNYFHYQQHMVQPGSSAPTSVAPLRTDTIYEDQYDINKIRHIITTAKYGRCRQRFVVPVMMYRGKYICRSATISINAETYGRKVVDFAYDCLNGTNYSERRTVDDENNEKALDSFNPFFLVSSPFTYDEVIRSDVQLLHALNVHTIVDLMVEMRKIKFRLTVSSSEKCDPDNHYENLNLLALPYPGCEFFKRFRDNNYLAKDLHYDWAESFNDANLSVPAGPAADLNINWDDYKNWDVVLLTQNYLKACLKYIQEGKSGLLIHCISGWDRTPLFITLVRLSLWADGLMHKSLNALQITYLVLAYDWYLFGHQFPNRTKKGEDILFFCFHVVKFIMSDEFSIVENRKRTKTSSSSGSSSITLLKSDVSDEEPHKEEDFNLGVDQDSNDSISSISDNYYVTAPSRTPPQDSYSNVSGSYTLTNRSPNSKRSKTSPITVPGARQRHESTSSLDGWQVVSETGSLESTIIMPSPRKMDDGASNTIGVNDNPNNSDNAFNTSVDCTDAALNNAKSSNKDNSSSGKPSPSMRERRLAAVRSIFMREYGTAVGLKFTEVSSNTLSAVINTLTGQKMF